MGGSQSARKLTISNNDPTNVIKVSDSVVQRFRGEAEGAANKPGAGQENPAPVGAAVPVNPVPVVPKYHHSTISHPLAYPYNNEPSITSLQVRQEKERELRANDQHWQNRINQLEETHEKINQLMEQEYNSAMKEVKGNFLDAPTKRRSPVCVEGKKAVMKCYKDHPKEPMKCAQEVLAFAECVDKHRSDIVANRG